MALTLIRPANNDCGFCNTRAPADDITLPDGAIAYPAYDEDPGVVGRIRRSRHPAIKPHHLLHHTHMGGDNPPSERELHPRLHLAADALAVFTGKLGARHRHLIAEGGDGGIT